MKQETKSHLLAVDDKPANIVFLKEVLDGEYKVSIAMNGTEAIDLAGSLDVDLILLDVMMPGMNGYEVCRTLKEQPATKDIPVIFLTSLVDVDSKTKGFDAGSVDYITKPFSIQEVKARVRTHLSLKRSRELLADQNALLEERVEQRTRELALTQDVTIESLASLAEARDNETGRHIRRTQHYVRTLAERLRSNPRFRELLTTENIALIFKTSALHDIGKVGVPDQILLKPGKLTADEFELMKKHTTIGRDALQRAERGLGTNTFLRFAKEIAYSHHEWWDGTGYPVGLAGGNIPAAARMMAVADVYDALTSKRVYKPAIPHAEAVTIMQKERGTHFDPDVIDAFLDAEDRFLNISHELADDDIE